VTQRHPATEGGVQLISQEDDVTDKQFCDVNGREYAQLSKLKPGDKVEIDDGFDCMTVGSVKEVRRNDDGELYIECAETVHTLDGQLMDDADHLVGIYPA
jgi:hypothetical protein